MQYVSMQHHARSVLFERAPLNLLYCLPYLCRQVLTTADGIATKHKQAASRAARTHNSTDNNMQQGGTSTSYYADPLKLSPLADMPYLFVANARRMMVRNSEVIRAHSCDFASVCGANTSWGKLVFGCASCHVTVLPAL